MNKKNKFDQKNVDLKIIEYPETDEIFLPVFDFSDLKNLTPGTRVNENEEIAPWIFSPVNGEIKEKLKISVDGVVSNVLRISVSDSKEDPDLPENENYSDLSEDVLLYRLKKSGMKIDIDTIKDSEIIISAVETDPLCSVSQQLVRENIDKLKDCFEMFKFVLKKEDIYFAVQENIYDLVWELQTSGITVHKVPPFYPNGLPEILVNSMKKIYGLKSPVYLSIEDAIKAMEVIKTNMPIKKKVVTLTDEYGVSNFRVNIGTPIREILKKSDIKKIKKVVVGGPFRGYANYDLNSPVTEKTDSIFIQYLDEVVKGANNQCINCGRCNDTCPALLQVNLICRYSEFSIFEKCQEMHVKSCIECGLCSYYCPTERSLLQLIRLAKSEINKKEREVNP